MTLTIHKDTSVNALQRAFNNSYAFLRIELFTQKHGFRQPSSARNKVAPTALLREIAPVLEEGSIELFDSMTVNELESILSNRFNLHSQVFRKSGNLWLETTMTDSWTLKQQNEHGREISV